MQSNLLRHFGSIFAGAVLLAASSTAAAQSTWTFLAAEWASFSLPAPQRVRYGANATWVERDLPAGAGQCTNAVFGDPLPGTPKRCEAQVSSPGSWNFLANEWASFNLTSSQRVRYGANGTWVERTLPAGPGQCSNAVFGDPLPGIVKNCEVFAGGAAQVPGSIPVISREDVGVTGERKRVVTHTSTQVSFDESAFRVRCVPSHFSYEDPIVFPGTAPGPGAHLHMFFGNTAADRYLNASNIRSFGNSTCSGGTLNRSAYWVPAMLGTGGQRILPYEIFVYYKSGDLPGPSLESLLPPGLRMVAGNPHATQPQGSRFDFVCLNLGTGRGTLGDLDVSQSGLIPTSCGAGDVLQQKIAFPQCWNGNLDSPNHKDHMTYPVPNSAPQTGYSCPSTHPRAIPQITFVFRYAINSNLSTWRLDSDDTSARGLSNHADWFNGWDSATSTTWLSNCTRRPANNLNDCRVDLLGDGTELYYR
jgi:hypothetical protein